MNDFFTATNRTLPVKFGEDTVHVRQIVVSELDAVSVVAEPIKRALNNDLANARAAFDAVSVESVVLAAMLCDIPQQHLIERMRDNVDAVAALCEHVIHVNAAYFIDDEPSSSEAHEPLSWYAVFQLLISAGHSHHDVMAMTYGAFVGYLKAVRKLQSMQHVLTASTMRMAHHADSSEFAKLLEQMKL